MAGGAEEFRAWNPSVRDNLYLPDEHMTQDLLASATRQKLAALNRYGDLQAENARIGPEALEKGFNAYQGGKQRGLAEEGAKQNLRAGSQEEQARNQKMKLGDIQLEQAKNQQSEENAYRDFLNQPNAGGAPGATRRQGLNEARFKSDINEPTFKSEEHTMKMDQIRKEMKLTDFQLGQMGLTAANAKEQKERDDLQTAFAGIYGNKTMTPEQQDQAAAQLEQQHSGGKIPPQVVSGYRVAGRNGAVAAAQQGQLNHQILVQGTEPYQHMARSTGSAQSDAQTIQHLGELRNQYKNNLRFGGNLTGKLGGEGDVSSQSREDFAKSLDDMGKHELADHVRGAGPTAVGGRMDDVIKTLAGQTTSAWRHEKQAIHPSMQQGPEVGQADQAIAGLSTLTGPNAGKNTVPLAPGVGATTGSTANAMFLGGGQKPPGGMQQTGGAPPQQGGAIKIPGYNPGMPPAQNGALQAGRIPNQQGTITPPGFQGAPPPGGMPGGGTGYPYDFSKYRVNQQMPATGMGVKQ
jgi:hypothetical protein